MIYYYADIMPDGLVRACFSYEGPDEGPLEPYWESQAEGQVMLLDVPIDWKGPSNTAVLYWLEGAFAWVETASLDVLKERKWDAIKACRSAVELGPFTYNGMVFDGDLDAQRRLTTYISVSKSALASGGKFSAEFILADNTVVQLSAQDFVAIELTKANQVAAAFSQAAQLRAQIYAAQSTEELAEINWV